MTNVRDYGAKGDRKRWILRHSVRDRGGGEEGRDTVVIPQGDYLSGTIRLRSHITLQLELRRDVGGPAPIPRTSWSSRLAGGDGRGAGIGHRTGRDQSRPGHGRLRQSLGCTGTPQSSARASCSSKNCRDVTIRDVTILNSDSWTLHLKGCEKVRIDR